jgi:hypothetical protein
MKIRISHLNGQYDLSNHTDLCELFCKPENEDSKYLFENGWLPYSNGEWYQCRSSRVKISPISSRRKRQLEKIKISKEGNYLEIMRKSKFLYDDAVEEFLHTMLSFKHEIYYFNDNTFAVLNWFDDIPYYSLVLGGRVKKDGSTPLSCYHFIDELANHSYPYLYIGEWYDQFYYKSHYPNFEWWDGEKWVENNF